MCVFGKTFLRLCSFLALKLLLMKAEVKATAFLYVSKDNINYLCVFHVTINVFYYACVYIFG